MSPDLLHAAIRFEIALARAQANLGLIPAEAAQHIAALADYSFQPADLETLEAGEDHDGVPMPALLGLLRSHLPAAAAPWLHFGATSQDALDTALVLVCKPLRQALLEELDALIGDLAALAETHVGTLMAARTRHRRATAITFGFMLAGRAVPLARSRRELQDLGPALEQLQLGGSAGVLGAFDDPEALAKAVAAQLNLRSDWISWQTQRDLIAHLGSCLERLAASLAGIAEDLLFLSSEEVGEVTLLAGGGSSTMPHKVNPVLFERVIADHQLTSNDARVLANLPTARLQRDGRLWPLEAQLLPPLVKRVRSSLVTLRTALGQVQPQPERMREHLEARGGAAHGEALRFLLQQTFGPAEAQTLLAEIQQQSDGTLLEAAAAHPRMANLARELHAIQNWTQELTNAATLTQRLLGNL